MPLLINEELFHMHRKATLSPYSCCHSKLTRVIFVALVPPPPPRCSNYSPELCNLSPVIEQSQIREGVQNSTYSFKHKIVLQHFFNQQLLQ